MNLIVIKGKLTRIGKELGIHAMKCRESFYQSFKEWLHNSLNFNRNLERNGDRFICCCMITACGVVAVLM